MKGLMYYDACIIGNYHRCNMCGKHIDDLKAWGLLPLNIRYGSGVEKIRKNADAGSSAR